MRWYYLRDGRAVGPVGIDQLMFEANLHRLAPEDLVRSEAMADWVPAASVAELFANVTSGSVPGAAPDGVVAPQSSPVAQDPLMRMMLPVGRSGWAIAAGYVALLAMFPAFALALVFLGDRNLAWNWPNVGFGAALLAPTVIALLLAWLARRDLRRHPEKHGGGRVVFTIIVACLNVAAVALAIQNHNP